MALRKRPDNRVTNYVMQAMHVIRIAVVAILLQFHSVKSSISSSSSSSAAAAAFLTSSHHRPCNSFTSINYHHDDETPTPLVTYAVNPTTVRIRRIGMVRFRNNHYLQPYSFSSSAPLAAAADAQNEEPSSASSSVSNSTSPYLATLLANNKSSIIIANANFTTNLPSTQYQQLQQQSHASSEKQYHSKNKTFFSKFISFRYRFQIWKLYRIRLKRNEQRRQRKEEENKNRQKDVQLRRQPRTVSEQQAWHTKNNIINNQERFKRLKMILLHLLRSRSGASIQEKSEVAEGQPKEHIFLKFWKSIHSILLSPWFGYDNDENKPTPSPSSISFNKEKDEEEGLIQPSSSTSSSLFSPTSSEPMTHEEMISWLLGQAKLYLLGDAHVRQILGTPISVVGGSKSAAAYAESNEQILQLHGHISKPVEIGFQVYGKYNNGVAIAVATSHEGIVKLTLHVEEETSTTDNDNNNSKKYMGQVIPVSLSPKPNSYCQNKINMTNDKDV